MKASVLVFGGAGYIGSHTCKALNAAGLSVVVADDLSTGHVSAVKWGQLEVGSLLDPQFLDALFDRYQPCAVMQFAAKISVGESTARPADYYECNLLGTFRLLEAMRKRVLVPFVFSSTAAVYGNPLVSPIHEGHQICPISPYGRSKAMIESILKDYCVAYGLKYVSLRYFNASGADAECEIGEAHEPETHLIPLAFDAALGVRDALHVYGDDYPTPDGTCIRDYVSVVDLANAHLAALRYLLSGGESVSLNVGTGHGYSVLDVLTAVERCTGLPVPRTMRSRRDGDPPVLVADPSQICKVLHWKAEHSHLSKIVDSAWAWHRKLRAPDV